MLKILTITLLLLHTAHALVIKPRSMSHRSIINDILVSGDRVYSVSNDHTLKIWDSNLTLLDTVYEKKSGAYGNLYSIGYL